MQFIIRRGNALIVGNSSSSNSPDFRFLSFNTPNLHVVEDPYWHRVTSWEQGDLLDSVKLLGGRVVRLYPFSLSKNPASDDSSLRHFTMRNGDWQLNEELFKDLDSAIQLATERDLRLIIPFIDNFDFWGGIPTFTSLNRLSPQDFYTHPELRRQFKSLVRQVLERRNALTGRLYKEEPAVLAWETGNELMMNNGRIPSEWTLDVTRFIKSLSPEQLIMDGSYGKEGWDAEVLKAPWIDIYSNHYYPEGFWDVNLPAFIAASVFFVALLLLLLWTACTSPKVFERGIFERIKSEKNPVRFASMAFYYRESDY